MKNLKLILFLMAIILVTNPVCRINAEQKAPEKVSIGIQDNTIVATVLVAKAKDFFAKEGLDVNIKKYPSGKLALEAMLKNETDLATVAGIPIVMESFNRDDFLILSGIAYSEKGIWVIARKDRGINGMSDLKGKKIATQENSASHFFLSMFLLHNHILESDVGIVYLQPQDMVQAFINGDIDAFSLRNPYISQAKAALGDKAIEFFELGAYRQTFNLVGRRGFIKEKPEVIKKVLKAMLKAEAFMRDNTAEAKKAVVAQLGQEREKEVTDDWNIYQFEISLEQSLIITLEDVARWAIKNGLTQKKEIPNYLDFIYLEALNEIDPDNVTIIK